MRFGLGFFAIDDTLDPAAAGRATEAAGFDSIFVTEHTHIPVQSRHPAHEEVPRYYKRTLDPFVTLSAIAPVTTTLRLGFGIALIAQRDPITTAKAIASLDHISGGRVDLGIGAGWNEPELKNHARPFDRRFKVMREHLEAMRAIWTQDEAAYDGEFVSFGPLWSWPKPVQQPLPVHVGGDGPGVLDRVLRYGDHWMPMFDLPSLPDRIAELRRRAEEAGRPRPEVTYFGVPHKPEAIERFRSYGVDQALMLVKSGEPAATEEAIGRVGELVRDAEQARDRFSATRVARLATAGPHVVPICFAVSGDVIWSAVDDAKPKRTRALRRLDNIAADPRVSLVCDHYDDEDWTQLWWARADGTAAILDSAPEGLDLLCARYPQYAAAPPPGPFLQISVARWSGWAATADS